MHEIWSRPLSKVSPIFLSSSAKDFCESVPVSKLLYYRTLSNRGVRYHEPEHWKFGEAGNKYFRHATGQLYAISKDLASYISINQ